MRSKRSGSFGVKTAVREKPRFLKKGTLNEFKPRCNMFYLTDIGVLPSV